MNVDIIIAKLKAILRYKIEEKNYTRALDIANLLSEIYYDYNQIYTDKELEDILLRIRDEILEINEYIPDSKNVFFYDGFGLDLRGWAIAYVKALSKLGYKVIYSCPNTSKGKIPHILSELESDNSYVIYIDNKLDLVDKTICIDGIFKRYKPCVAFFYTMPNDISASIAFSNNMCTTRFQVDLTDHAYWIGTNAFDYIIECREMGASLALYERHIKMDQIIKLDCAPYVANDKYEEPYPFDIFNEKYIFTGGALYKTLGDSELLYYKTVRYILEKYKDIVFLYAGNGDDHEIRKLVKCFPNRVFHINERPDFFEMIKNCVIYLNSYPMFGGLMMRYAALANKVPITLKHEHDSDGILINQDKLGVEFDDYDEYISEIDKLLSDVEYRKAKEKLVKNAVISEEIFARNIDLMIKEHRTEYCFEKIDRIDTTRFRREYKKRYNSFAPYKAIATKKNFDMLPYFLMEFFVGYIIKIFEKLHN